MEFYNKNKIIKILVCDKRETNNFYYAKKKKFLGITTITGGFYTFYHDRLSTEEIKALRSNYIIENNIIYNLPKIVIYLESDISKKIEFNTYKEASEYVTKFIKEHDLSKDIIMI